MFTLNHQTQLFRTTANTSSLSNPIIGGNLSAQKNALHKMPMAKPLPRMLQNPSTPSTRLAGSSNFKMSIMNQHNHQTSSSAFSSRNNQYAPLSSKMQHFQNGKQMNSSSNFLPAKQPSMPNKYVQATQSFGAGGPLTTRGPPQRSSLMTMALGNYPNMNPPSSSSMYQPAPRPSTFTMPKHHAKQATLNKVANRSKVVMGAKAEPSEPESQQAATAPGTIDEKYIQVSKEVQDALDEGRPVLALESTIITHGMEYPLSCEVALDVERIVREQGCVPATMAVINGVVKVGISKDEIEHLAKTRDSRKCSRRDFAYVIAKKMNGSTTVAGSMYVADKVGIKVFATGGLGGVHRGAEDSFDISTDMTELAKTPVAIVSAGVKSILDIPKTLEYLETQGVPVVAYQQDAFPDFFTQDSGKKAEFRLDTPEECAAMIQAQYGMGLQTGIFFANPIPKDKEADPEKVNKAIAEAEKECKLQGITGGAVTPFMLKKLHEITDNYTARVNQELIKNNVKLGAQIAVALSNLQRAETLGKAEATAKQC